MRKRSSRFGRLDRRSGLLQRFFGNESNNLAACRDHAVARSFMFHEREDPRDRSLLEIGQVHGNLGHSADLEAVALYVAQPARGKPYCFGNFLGNCDISSIEEDIVGDQRRACADDRCASRAHEL